MLVTNLAIHDGQVTPPVLGQVERSRLRFHETSPDDRDATIALFRARAEPLSSSPPRQGRRWNGSPSGHPPQWPTLLVGDGWQAHWSAPRPVVGELELHGTLLADLEIGSLPATRGRVTRIRVVSDTIDTSDPDRRAWRPLPHLQGLRDVDTAPRWFANGLVRPPGATTGWYAPVPADPYVRERGALVDLDLDDVPPADLRPALVPGALATDAGEQWLADIRLPLVHRRDRSGRSSEYRWDGGVLSVEHQRARRLHADPAGCWVTGPDGVHRCDAAGVVRRLSPDPAWLAAAGHGLLAVQVLTEPDRARSREQLRLLDDAGRSHDVPLRGHRLRALTATDDGFLLLLTVRARPYARRAADPTVRFARLDTGGHLWIGAPLPGRAHEWSLLGGQPALAVGPPQRVYRVAADLTAGVAVGMPERVLAGWTGHGRLVTAAHAPAGQPGWVLTEHDPLTGEPLAVCTATRLPAQLAIDATGVCWLEDGHVRHWG